MQSRRTSTKAWGFNIMLVPSTTCSPSSKSDKIVNKYNISGRTAAASQPLSLNHRLDHSSHAEEFIYYTIIAVISSFRKWNAISLQLSPCLFRFAA
jgi:hypothetical protein